MTSNSINNDNQYINNAIERCTQAGSDYVIDNIFMHSLKINRYKPLSAKSFIPLIKEIANKKATIDIKK